MRGGVDYRDRIERLAHIEDRVDSQCTVCVDGDRGSPVEFEARFPDCDVVTPYGQSWKGVKSTAVGRDPDPDCGVDVGCVHGCIRDYCAAHVLHCAGDTSTRTCSRIDSGEHNDGKGKKYSMTLQDVKKKNQIEGPAPTTMLPFSL